MLEIVKFAVENLETGCVTDNTNPVFCWSAKSENPDCSINKAEITVKEALAKDENTQSCFNAINQTGVCYNGNSLKPFTLYKAILSITDNNNNTATKSLTFETGRLNESWQAKWISDNTYHFTEKKVSPVPMVFNKSFSVDRNIKNAQVYATAIGIYELYLNGSKVGNRYFAPGFTSYKTHLQYQTYDITNLLQETNDITAHVAGGWAVGSYVFTRANRITAKRQAFLCEIRITYEDNSTQIIATDTSWNVCEDGPFVMADIYDGETFDSTKDLSKAKWNKATIEDIKINPEIKAEYGSPVKHQEIFEAKSVRCLEDGSIIYDFGQNFAGVVALEIKNASDNQKIIVKHAEILNPGGTLNTSFLRSAKATVTYICHKGKQSYTPSLTYMGFRYVQVSGINKEDIIVKAIAMYSDIKRTGEFSCSSDMINQLQSNIEWSLKSNFFDIPTDCPQRDERMGWTGDIAVFAPTACYNYDINRFLNKWLLDVKAEQYKNGGIPNTVPSQSYGFPTTMPPIAVDWWDDACILVPYSHYMTYGDKAILEMMYPVMTKYVNACLKQAHLLGFGHKRYIWNTLSMLHFGDWVAPDVPKMSQWQARSKWTATASICNTSATLSKIAKILGKEEDSKKYEEISIKTARAYEKEFTDGKGKLKTEFQTGYVLPIYLDMFKTSDAKKNAVDNLERLIKENDYCIGTGFPGTPYILFALADNGKSDTAYNMLLNTKCPSWLYEVKSGATTIWERWDGLDENGQCPISNDGTGVMISYNHYASGAVGAFLYQRIAGIQSSKPGYKEFEIRPVVTDKISFAKGKVITPYGELESTWSVKGKSFEIKVTVPLGTEGTVVLPDGQKHSVKNGRYTFTCNL